MPKSVPLSVRIPHEDAEFLASLEIEGASTPSDKLRQLIRQFREEAQSDDYYSAGQRINRKLQTLDSVLAEGTEQFGHPSEVMKFVRDWLPDMFAYVAYSQSLPVEQADLQRFEADVVERMMQLLEQVLRLAVTDSCRAYDKTVVSDRVSVVLELAELVIQQRKNRID